MIISCKMYFDNFGSARHSFKCNLIFSIFKFMWTKNILEVILMRKLSFPKGVTWYSSLPAFLVRCPVGSYFDDDSEKCKVCSEGTFNNKEGALKCTPCPAGQWTYTNRSENVTSCRGWQPHSFLHDLQLFPEITVTSDGYLPAMRGVNILV